MIVFRDFYSVNILFKYGLSHRQQHLEKQNVAPMSFHQGQFPAS